MDGYWLRARGWSVFSSAALLTAYKCLGLERLWNLDSHFVFLYFASGLVAISTRNAGSWQISDLARGVSAFWTVLIRAESRYGEAILDTAWFSDGAAPWKPDNTLLYFLVFIGVSVYFVLWFLSWFSPLTICWHLSCVVLVESDRHFIMSFLVCRFSFASFLCWLDWRALIIFQDLI